MKKVKLAVGLIIVLFAGLIVYQNRAYFFTKQALSLSLGVETWHWTAPGVQNIVYFGVFLLIGLLVAGFFGISSKLRSRKIIKSLNATIESHLQMISTLKNELQPYKNDPYAGAEKTGTATPAPAPAPAEPAKTA
jgi:hypothetical protein